jgi:hypothetical protein
MCRDGKTTDKKSFDLNSLQYENPVFINPSPRYNQYGEY